MTAPTLTADHQRVLDAVRGLGRVQATPLSEALALPLETTVRLLRDLVRARLLRKHRTGSRGRRRTAWSPVPVTPDDAPIRTATPEEARAYARQHLTRIRARLAHHRTRLDEHGPEAPGLAQVVADLEAQERDALETFRLLGLEDLDEITPEELDAAFGEGP